MTEKDEFYRTPADTTRLLLRRLGCLPPESILEPGCGDGAIMRIVAEMWPSSSILGVELNEERAQLARRHGEVICANFLTQEFERPFSIAIGNPPFSKSVPFALRCSLCARETALLLPLSIMASAERQEFWRTNKADAYVLPRRPCFMASLRCGTQKDSCGWSLKQPIEDDRPKQCPNCGRLVSVSTSAAAEYAWFVWGPGRGGHWDRLEEG